MGDTIYKMQDRIDEEFPVRTKRLNIKRISVSDLIEIRHKTGYVEESSMTCRPIVKRSEAGLEGFYANLLEDNNSAIFSLNTIEENRLIGKVSFYDYNSRNKSLELGYYLITEQRNKGYMEEALYKLQEVMFKKVGIAKVYAQTASFNQASILMLEKMRFTRDGVLRKHHELDGNYYDDYIYSILDSEWNVGTGLLQGDCE